jgi:hypothetical protein
VPAIEICHDRRLALKNHGHLCAFAWSEWETPSITPL